MRMVTANFRRTRNSSIGLIWGSAPPPPDAQSASLNEPNELSQWLWIWLQHHKNCYYYHTVFRANILNGWVLRDSFLHSVRDDSDLLTQVFHKVV